MIEIRDRDGKVIRRSDNLRGLVQAFGDGLNRNSWVDEIQIMRGENGKGGLSVLFSGGHSCNVEFASYTVLTEWLASRQNLKGVRCWAWPGIVGTIGDC